MDFKNDVLLTGWQGWDGNGVCDIPAKNVTLLSGKKGCILLGWEGVGIYDASAEEIGDTIEEGEAFLTFADMRDDSYETIFASFISKQDIEECKIVFENYMKYDAA